MCVMRQRLLALLCAALYAAASPSRADEVRPAAPDATCLDARQVAELQQADARTLAVTGQQGRLFRLRLAEDCPDIANQTGASLLAAHGWVCNGAVAFVGTGTQRCAITQVEPIDARTYASIARYRATDGTATLDPVTVRQSRRRNFAGSSSYCFNPSMLRSWSEDPDGLLVEVSARHPGTHRYYRVELLDSCRELSGAPPIQFVSGMGINAICGNPGDKVTVLDELSLAGAAAGSGQQGEFATSRGGMLARLRQSCTIAAVYPRD
ncbi:DUF6491 family protein [Xanthomonas campestris]|uniref:DUF6491 family protein n=1 Tax=Xanthomonas campestris TaxID=339 RepID=UPI00235A3C80|nr:DUF6491 family protein [Xanthomonas campestris]MDC8746868.1 DUF6491 family protein [Xanthomonas campestris]